MYSVIGTSGRKFAFGRPEMRTTLREKAVLWVNGLALAGGAELLLRSQTDLLSLPGLALIGAGAVALVAFTTWALRGGEL
jgi:hypothetical protein